jgi:hypothetical protein
MFRRKILSPSSGSMNKPVKKLPASSMSPVIDIEVVAHKFFRKIGLSQTAQCYNPNTVLFVATTVRT